jgi:hypothetical protein
MRNEAFVDIRLADDATDATPPPAATAPADGATPPAPVAPNSGD